MKVQYNVVIIVLHEAAVSIRCMAHKEPLLA